MDRTMTSNGIGKRNGPGVIILTFLLRCQTVGKFFTLHCSGSLSCMNEYLAIDNGGYLYEQAAHINCSVIACF